MSYNPIPPLELLITTAPVPSYAHPIACERYFDTTAACMRQLNS